MAVVPDHRCGAVPDSHRVPCCPAGPGGSTWARGPSAGKGYSTERRTGDAARCTQTTVIFAMMAVGAQPRWLPRAESL